MNTERIKSVLLSTIGEGATARVHAVRFWWLLRSGRNRDHEMPLLRAFLGPGDVAIDVGANGANWTWALSEAVGAEGRVYAFEADPYYAEVTRQTLALQRARNVEFFAFGLSDKEERLGLRVLGSGGERHSGLGHVDRGADSEDPSVRWVRLCPLDSLVAEHARLRQARFLKVDVEGYELFVLRGAAEVLRLGRPTVLLEVGHYDRQGYTAADIHAFFAERDYTAWAMVGPDRLAPADDRLGNDGALGPNRLLIPRERLAAVGAVLELSG